VYVRALSPGRGAAGTDLTRIADETGHQRYDYNRPAFKFANRLVYDEAGLVLRLSGVAVRAG